MNFIVPVLIGLLAAVTAPATAAEDAAIEAKEGDIGHWIEYYRKERGIGNETVTDDKNDADPNQPGGKAAESPTPPSPPQVTPAVR